MAMNQQTTDLLRAAEQILIDFDEWGCVLQADAMGDYSPSTAIEILRAAVVRIAKRK